MSPSATEHAFHRITPSPKKGAKCNLCVRYEFEFFQLCALRQKEKHPTMGVSDLSDKLIRRAANYLEKVAQLDVHRG
jgi:hypothetical protein